MNRIVLTSALVLVVAPLAAAGCAAVKPWERGTLAQPHMQFQVCAGEGRQIDGVREITEGTTFSGGASDSAGAGCGCH